MTLNFAVRIRIFVYSFEAVAHRGSRRPWRIRRMKQVGRLSGSILRDGASPTGAALMTQFQGEWRFCKKCSNMTFNLAPRPGVCVAGGDHLSQGFNFELPFDRPEGERDQRHFFFCSKCHCLFQNIDFGGGDLGTCAAGGQHDRTDSFEFVLPHDRPVTNGQDKWTVCVNCSVMFWGPAEHQPCIKNPLSHNPGSDFLSFNLPHSADPSEFIP
jgi:hypothetical protein